MESTGAHPRTPHGFGYQAPFLIGRWISTYGPGIGSPRKIARLLTGPILPRCVTAIVEYRLCWSPVSSCKNTATAINNRSATGFL
jgi:hypothetical protein